MEQQPLRPLRILLVAFVAGAILWWLFGLGLGAFFPRATPIHAEPIVEQNSGEAASPTPLVQEKAGSEPPVLPSPSLESVSGQTKSVLLDNETKTRLLDCARGSSTFSGVGQPNEFTTLDQFLEKAPATHGGESGSQDLIVENLEFSHQNGGKIRVRISPQTGTSKKQRKFEVFGVDSEGLPIVIPFPKAFEGKSEAEKLALIRRKFETQDFDQKTMAFRWPNGGSATVSFRNGEVEEMQAFFENHGSVGCQAHNGKAECNCLKSASN